MIYILRDLLSGRQIYPQKLWKLYMHTHTIQGKLNLSVLLEQTLYACLVPAQPSSADYPIPPR